MTQRVDSDLILIEQTDRNGVIVSCYDKNSNHQWTSKRKKESCIWNHTGYIMRGEKKGDDGSYDPWRFEVDRIIFYNNIQKNDIVLNLIKDMILSPRLKWKSLIYHLNTIVKQAWYSEKNVHVKILKESGGAKDYIVDDDYYEKLTNINNILLHFFDILPSYLVILYL